MSANLPTKTPDAPLHKPVENKFDRFRPDMPKIPGVSSGSRQAGRGPSGAAKQRLLQIGGITAAAVLLCAVIFWRVKVKTRSAANPSSDSEIAEQASPASPQPNSARAAHDGETLAATLDELSNPWAAKKFIFVNPPTQEHFAAIVIRLPGDDFWAFALRGPFTRCELEYVTDLGTLASQYNFKASHPMVVSPCDGTVFDPLKVGPLVGNTWARGEIVHGSSLRPPISIDVKVSGRSVVADGIE
jgi:hypothetical protein